MFKRPIFCLQPQTKIVIKANSKKKKKKYSKLQILIYSFDDTSANIYTINETDKIVMLHVNTKLSLFFFGHNIYFVPFAPRLPNFAYYLHVCVWRVFGIDFGVFSCVHGSTLQCIYIKPSGLNWLSPFSAAFKCQRTSFFIGGLVWGDDGSSIKKRNYSIFKTKKKTE